MLESPDSDIDNIISKISEVIPDDGSLGAHDQTFAFGLKAIMGYDFRN